MNDMAKIQSCFEAALAVPEENRTSFLRNLCKQDSALFNEVMALLDADSQTKVWEADGNRDSEVNSMTASRPENEIGPYTILEQIGEGGMGVVYKAYDNRLQRDIALKMLPLGMNKDPQLRQRLIAEARAASRLDHPNICIIHDVGETADGQLYIAMAYYQGKTLSERIQRGALLVQDSIYICLQVCEALSVAHQKQIVHRDIKPANILINDVNQVKVLDFGIAKIESENLTQTGMSLGTLAYMSPEQLRGEKADAGADIWALGVVLYEMLTGKQAFPARAMADVLKDVLNQPEKILLPLENQFPQEVYRVLQKTIAGDKRQRFQTMDEVVDSLYTAHEVLNNPVESTRLFSQPKTKSYDWDEHVLQGITDLLLPELGPIAETLVRRSSGKARDLTQLGGQLRQFLPEGSTREAFDRQLKNKTSELTSPPLPAIVNTDGSVHILEISILMQSQIETSLAEIIGPIAKSLVKRYLSRAKNLAQFYDMLEHHLNSDDEKKRFKQLFNKHTDTD